MSQGDKKKKKRNREEKIFRRSRKEGVKRGDTRQIDKEAGFESLKKPSAR